MTFEILVVVAFRIDLPEFVDPKNSLEVTNILVYIAVHRSITDTPLHTLP